MLSAVQDLQEQSQLHLCQYEVSHGWTLVVSQFDLSQLLPDSGYRQNPEATVSTWKEIRESIRREVKFACTFYGQLFVLLELLLYV